MQRQKSHKVAFRRLRSRSFERSVEVHRKKSSKPFLPPIDEPTPPVLQCSESIVLWRVQKNCEIFLFLHEELKIFEVVTIDRSSGDARELNRLYVPRSGIEDIIKRSKYVKHIRAQRMDLLDRALLNGGIDYIVETLDCSETSSLHQTQAIEMRLQRFDAESKCTSPLTVPKPCRLRPAELTSSQMLPVATPGGAAEIQRHLSKGLRRISVLTNSAMEKFELSNADVVLEKITATQGAGEKVYSETNVNPNMYTAHRWKWIWNINRVIHKNRLAKLLEEMTALRQKKRTLLPPDREQRPQVSPIQAHQEQQRQQPQLTVQAQNISLSEMMDTGVSSCPSHASKPDFRQLAFKNLQRQVQVPVFKVSVSEIYQASRVSPPSFDLNAKEQKSPSYRRLKAAKELPAPRPRYNAIHASA